MSNNKTFVILSLGSNVGDKIKYLQRAIFHLQNENCLFDANVSAFYESEPYGEIEQDWFVNIAISGYTKYTPIELLKFVKSLEKKLGRIERERWKEREIDIDIIFYGNKIITKDELIIPHKEAHLRRFVLIPINEIEPNFIHPFFNKTISQLLNECNSQSIVKRI